MRRSITVYDLDDDNNTYIETGKRYSASHKRTQIKKSKTRGNATFSGLNTVFERINGAHITQIASYVFRILAFLCSFVVIANTFLSGGARAALLGITSFTSKLVPAVFSGLYVVQSPFGGAFRGDIAIVAVLLFALDWILNLVSNSLEH